MKPYCIIAARGGSKRIINKNIIKVSNKHIISYPISCALKSKLFKEVFVTTDSKKISTISKKNGANVPFLRNKKLANDKVGLQEVIVDFIKKQKLENEKFIVFIYATAILITKQMLNKAIKKFQITNSDFMIGIQEFKSNPLRAFEIKNNQLRFVNSIYSKKNTQNLKKFYHDAGSFFIFKTSTIMKSSFKLPKKTTYYLHKKFEVCDIDDTEDLEFAKIILENKKNV